MGNLRRVQSNGYFSTDPDQEVVMRELDTPNNGNDHGVLLFPNAYLVGLTRTLNDVEESERDSDHLVSLVWSVVGQCASCLASTCLSCLFVFCGVLGR